MQKAILQIILAAGAALAIAAPPSWAGVPLNSPLNAQNSCAIKLQFAVDNPVNRRDHRVADGKAMRVPKFLVAHGNEWCPTGDVERFFAVFRFPDMTTSGWNSVASRMMDRDKGQYKVDPDVFSVLVQNLVYFGPRPKTLSEKAWPPYPDRVLHNLFCENADIWPCNYQGGRKPTAIVGLDGVFNAEFVRTHPYYVPPPNSGEVYASKTSAAHSAFVECDSEIGFTCRAHVYSERTGLQWDMEFPRESIVHYQKLVNKMEIILSGWIR